MFCVVGASLVVLERVFGAINSDKTTESVRTRVEQKARDPDRRPPTKHNGGFTAISGHLRPPGHPQLAERPGHSASSNRSDQRSIRPPFQGGHRYRRQFPPHFLTQTLSTLDMQRVIVSKSDSACRETPKSVEFALTTY
eukprot:2912102-Prymnesium_polylepis.2